MSGVQARGVAGGATAAVLQQSKDLSETIGHESILPDVDIVCSVADMADVNSVQLQDSIQGAVISLNQLLHQKQLEGYHIGPVQSTVLNLSSSGTRKSFGPSLFIYTVVYRCGTSGIPSADPVSKGGRGPVEAASSPETHITRQRHSSKRVSKHARIYWPGLTGDRYRDSNPHRTGASTCTSSSSEGTNLGADEHQKIPAPEVTQPNSSPCWQQPPQLRSGRSAGPLLWVNALFDASLSNPDDCSLLSDASVEAAVRPVPGTAPRQADTSAVLGRGVTRGIGCNPSRRECNLAGDVGDISGRTSRLKLAGSLELESGWSPLAIDDPSILFSSFDLLRDSRASSSISALLQSMEAGATSGRFRDSFVTNVSANAPGQTSRAAESWTDIFTSCRTAVVGHESQDGATAAWTTCRCLTRHDGSGEAGSACNTTLEELDVLSTVDLLTGALTVATGLGDGGDGAPEREQPAPGLEAPQQSGLEGSSRAGNRSRGVMDIVRGLEDVTKLSQEEAERQSRRLRRGSSVGASARSPWGSQSSLPQGSAPGGLADPTEDQGNEEHRSQDLQRGSSVSASARSFWETLTKAQRGLPSESPDPLIPLRVGQKEGKNEEDYVQKRQCGASDAQLEPALPSKTAPASDSPGGTAQGTSPPESSSWSHVESPLGENTSSTGSAAHDQGLFLGKNSPAGHVGAYLAPPARDVHQPCDGHMGDSPLAEIEAHQRGPTSGDPASRAVPAGTSEETAARAPSNRNEPVPRSTAGHSGQCEPPRVWPQAVQPEGIPDAREKDAGRPTGPHAEEAGNSSSLPAGPVDANYHTAAPTAWGCMRSLPQLEDEELALGAVQQADEHAAAKHMCYGPQSEGLPVGSDGHMQALVEDSLAGSEYSSTPRTMGDGNPAPTAMKGVASPLARKLKSVPASPLFKLRSPWRSPPGSRPLPASPKQSNTARGSPRAARFSPWRVRSPGMDATALGTRSAVRGDLGSRFPPKAATPAKSDASTSHWLPKPRETGPAGRAPPKAGKNSAETPRQGQDSPGKSPGGSPRSPQGFAPSTPRLAVPVRTALRSFLSRASSFTKRHVPGRSKASPHARREPSPAFRVFSGPAVASWDSGKPAAGADEDSASGNSTPDELSPRVAAPQGQFHAAPQRNDDLSAGPVLARGIQVPRLAIGTIGEGKTCESADPIRNDEHPHAMGLPRVSTASTQGKCGFEDPSDSVQMSGLRGDLWESWPSAGKQESKDGEVGATSPWSGVPRDITSHRLSPAESTLLSETTSEEPDGAGQSPLPLLSLGASAKMAAEELRHQLSAGHRASVPVPLGTSSLTQATSKCSEAPAVASGYGVNERPQGPDLSVLQSVHNHATSFVGVTSPCIPSANSPALMPSNNLGAASGNSKCSNQNTKGADASSMACTAVRHKTVLLTPCNGESLEQTTVIVGSALRQTLPQAQSPIPEMQALATMEIGVLDSGKAHLKSEEGFSHLEQQPLPQSLWCSVLFNTAETVSSNQGDEAEFHDMMDAVADAHLSFTSAVRF